MQEENDQIKQLHKNGIDFVLSEEDVLLLIIFEDLILLLLCFCLLGTHRHFYSVPNHLVFLN